MTTDRVLQFPLGLGSLRYLSITCSRVEWTRSWTIRSYHIHDSQAHMECRPQDYEGLTLSEAIDVACSLLAAVNEDYRQGEDGECHSSPHR